MTSTDKKEFKRLEKLADESENNDAQEAIMSAEQNASDTASENGWKSDQREDFPGYFKIALDSIYSTSAYEENKVVRDFFQKAGFI